MLKSLIVDDEPYVLEFISKGLKTFSDEVKYLTTTDSSHALEILEKEKIDVLITDLNLPGISGLELIEHVIKHMPHTVCILMTAYGNPKIEEIMNQYHVCYLEKPLDLHQLYGEIVKASQKWGREGQLNNVSLPTFVQVLVSKQLTCRVEVKCLDENLGGTLMFSKGRLFNADFQDLPPEKAAVALLSFKDTEISIHHQRRPFKRKITKNLDELLLLTESEQHEQRKKTSVPTSKPTSPSALGTDRLKAALDKIKHGKIKDADAAKKSKGSKDGEPGTEPKKGEPKRKDPKKVKAEKPPSPIQQILEDVANNMDSLIICTLMNMNGIPIASVDRSGGRLPIDSLAAKLTLMIALLRKSLNELGISTFKESLTETDKEWIIVRPINSGDHFLAVSVRRDAVLGDARIIVKEIAEKLTTFV